MFFVTRWKNVELNKQYVWEVHEILSACFWHFLMNTEFMEPILAEKTSFVYDSFWTLYIPISIKKTLCTVGHDHVLFVLFGKLQTLDILLHVIWPNVFFKILPHNAVLCITSFPPSVFFKKVLLKNMNFIETTIVNCKLQELTPRLYIWFWTQCLPRKEFYFRKFFGAWKIWKTFTKG